MFLRHIFEIFVHDKQVTTQNNRLHVPQANLLPEIKGGPYGILCSTWHQRQIRDTFNGSENLILERNVELNNMQDLIRVLEQIVEEGEAE